MAEGAINETDEATAIPLFRPTKRRKVFRQRDSSTEACTEPSATAQSLDELILSASNPSSELSVADIVRQRKILQRKRGGIEFSTPKPAKSTSERQIEQTTSVPVNNDNEAVGGRFAPQTGQVAVNDKHM